MSQKYATTLHTGARPIAANPGIVSESTVLQQLRKSRWPMIAFAILACITLCNLNGVTAVLFGMNRLMSIVILGIAFYLLASSRVRIPKALGIVGQSFTIFMFSFICVAAVSNPNPKYIFSFGATLILVVAAAVATRKLVEVFGLSAFLAVVTFFACAGAFSVFLTPFLGSYYAKLWVTDTSFEAGRWLGFFANPNLTGFACVYALATVISFNMVNQRKRGFRRVLIVACISSLTVGVILTFSRSAILGFFALGLGYMIHSLKFGARAIAPLAIAAVVIVAALWFFTGGYRNFELSHVQTERVHAIERMVTWQKRQSRDFGGREKIAASAIRYWSKSPFFGHGLGSFHSMPYTYGRGNGVHNTHLMVLGESGIVGFSLYLIFIVAFLFRALSARNQAIQVFALACLLGLVMSGFASHNVLEDRNLNLLLGICIGLISMNRQEQIGNQVNSH